MSIPEGFFKNATVKFDDKPSSVEGDRNPVCRLCGDHVEKHSTCSNRYMQIQGDYVGRHPEGIADMQADVVPVCDRCYFKVYDIDSRREIMVLGCVFRIDSSYRMND
jgi:hypothetical protein